MVDSIVVLIRGKYRRNLEFNGFSCGENPTESAGNVTIVFALVLYTQAHIIRKPGAAVSESIFYANSPGQC